MSRGVRSVGVLALALGLSAIGAQAVGAAWDAIVVARGATFGAYRVPAPANLRCQGLASLSSSRIVWDAVTGPAGQGVSYRVTTPAGATSMTSATSFPLPPLSLLAGGYRVETVISSGWRSGPSQINVGLSVLGLLYVCGSGSATSSRQAAAAEAHDGEGEPSMPARPTPPDDAAAAP